MIYYTDNMKEMRNGVNGFIIPLCQVECIRVNRLNHNAVHSRDAIKSPYPVFGCCRHSNVLAGFFAFLHEKIILPKIYYSVPCILI